MSELLGKETIDSRNYGRTFGSRGNYSANDQILGRELFTPDEVRMLDNQYALLFIRGERPVKDFKYNLKEHPNVNKTPIGNGKAYMHGNVTNAIGSISFDFEGFKTKDIIELETKETDYEILSEEEVEKLLKEKTEE